MRVSFTSNEGKRGAWTEGMVELHPEQMELGIPIDWPPDEVRDAQVETLLTFLADYVAQNGRPIRGKQTLRYGWTSLRTDPAGHPFHGTDLLILQELADPFGGELSFKDGVKLAIGLLADQQEAIRRCHVVGTVDHPHRDDTAVVCRRVSKDGGSSLLLARAALTNREFHDSGWIVGCRDRDHDHEDPTQLGGVHLWRLVASYPWIFPYLAMPVGTRVTLDRDQIVIFHPEERRGEIDHVGPYRLPRAGIGHTTFH